MLAPTPKPSTIVQLSEAQIDSCFADKSHQQDVLIAIYQLVFGADWERIESIQKWPSINSHCWEQIHTRFAEFDRLHHKNIFPAGLWFNSGMSVSVLPLRDWQVDTSTCQIIYKEAR